MDFSKKIRSGIFIGALLTTLSVILIFFAPSPFEMLENKLIDYRFKLRGAVQPTDKVVIAAIDEKSIESLGRWPWDRDKLALLLNRLTANGPEIVALDIILSENERHDPLLGLAIKNAGNVILPVVFEFEEETLPSGQPSALAERILLDSAFVTVNNPEMFYRYNPIAAKGVLTPAAALIRDSAGLGAINMFPDWDGTLRWEPMVISFRGSLYPSMALKAASIYLGIPRDKVVLNATTGIQLGKRRIPTDRFGRALINYYGPEGTFKRVPVSDILGGRVNPDFLKGKIVLVGTTAVGVHDLRVTPFSPGMPGVEKHASVISSILENRFIEAVPFYANLFVLILSGIAFTLLCLRLNALGASVITGLFLSIIFLCGYYFFTKGGIVVNITYPSINILTIFITTTAYNYAVEERYARKMRAMFSSYVTERVVNELIKNPDMAKMGGERREVTVLFSDIRDFTSFSEKHSPEEVVALLNEFLGAMTEIVFKWDGTLDKIMGDAIVVFWGAPLRQENHAELAVRCALNMTARLEDLRKKWISEGKAPLEVGIGINTGVALVGNIGAEGKKMDYTVIGDNVNLGSRIESLTRQYGANILISEFTMNRIRPLVQAGIIGHLAVKGLDKAQVKGREKPVGIYELKILEPNAASVILENVENTVVGVEGK